ncbi:dephospho-CoA kinase [Flavobacteriaceae bacterium]|jgi:dephospho-CoA kinase|nr:dephospho-CoA kinase [Flavobacteriaceae bacterium]|tara:strand:+ start:301 stop:897 length:597 start_codon:yes stop_codon:yes gene_type:complete
MIVGITGGIGSGKSLVAKTICALDNTAYYHADKEAKLLINTLPSLKENIIAVFGEKSYQDNTLNRKYISSLVFKEPELLKSLNNIVHPAVKEHFRNFIASQKENTLIIYENAILFETNGDLICNIIISVNAPEDTRIKRVMERDAVTKKQVKDIIKNQWSDTKRNLLSNYTIQNIEKDETLLKTKNIFNILTKKLLFI